MQIRRINIKIIRQWDSIDESNSLDHYQKNEITEIPYIVIPRPVMCLPR